MKLAYDIVMAAALAVGLFFNTLGVFGILRFPDVYTRLHADTKATTFGSIFTSLAVLMWLVRCWVGSGWDGDILQQAVHTVVAVVVLAVTNATGGHAISRAAWHAGIRPKQAVCDALSAAEGDAESAEKKEGEA